ncbi:SDR family oxidoreductase [Pantoea ananatis]
MGAGSGIGRVTAEAFAAQGAIVVVSDINDLAGKQTVQKILSNGQKAEFIQCDVSDESQVKTMIENIVKHHGKVDIAFNNAGLTQNSEPLSEQSLETFCSVFDVSVRGVFLSMKYQIAQMEKQGQGSIVNMGSMSSVVRNRRPQHIFSVKTCRSGADPKCSSGICRKRNKDQCSRSGNDRHAYD